MKKKNDEAGDMASFSFHAAVYKVQTMVDNGIRLTLDLAEDEIQAMSMLAECHRQGIPLVVEVKADV